MGKAKPPPTPPGPTPKELELQQQVESLTNHVQTIQEKHKRLSHVTGDLVEGMLNEHKTASRSTHDELQARKREAKEQEEQHRNKMETARKQLSDALSEIDSHMKEETTTKHTYVSCGSDQLTTCGGAKPPGSQLWSFLFCSKRSYDSYDDALEAPLNPYEERRRYSQQKDEDSNSITPSNTPERTRTKRLSQLSSP